MTIKEVEQRTGLARSNIRFYEKEKLIEPSRNDRNGYRDYSEADVAQIKKIAYLRTLEISVEDIRRVKSQEVTLMEIVEKQSASLQEQIAGLNQAKAACERMLQEGNVCFENLQVERYVIDVQNYWSGNQAIFKLDSVSFLCLWGSLMTWAAIALLCLAAGLLSYAKLPEELPVQWNHGIATSFVDKQFIFIYPVVCVLIRMVLRPLIHVKFLLYHVYGEMISEYLANYLCFIVLSVELFSILYVYGVVNSVVAVVLVDSVVLIGILVIGIVKMRLAS